MDEHLSHKYLEHEKHQLYIQNKISNINNLLWLLNQNILVSNNQQKFINAKQNIILNNKTKYIVKIHKKECMVGYQEDVVA